MIKDVKTYFNTVTARLSNVFNIQEFDLEEETRFWALASEYLSQKNAPSFRDIASWMDLLFRAPVHLAYIKEGETLTLFRQHVISENLEFMYDLVDEETKSEKDRQQVIRDFEDRLANIESKIRFDEELTRMGMSSFAIGQCQHIPLFKNDRFWGIYCVGPYVKTPETIVPRLSIITRILTKWLSQRYKKHRKRGFKETQKEKTENNFQPQKLATDYEQISKLFLSHLVQLHSARAALLARETTGFTLLDHVNLPEFLYNDINGLTDSDTSFTLHSYWEENRDEFQAQGFTKFVRYPLDDQSDTALYLLLSDEQRPNQQGNQELSEQIFDALAQLTRFRIEHKVFGDRLLQAYYAILRDKEQQISKYSDHTPRVIAFCSRFADLFGLNKDEKEVLVKTAKFHDIGYLNVEDLSIDTELKHPQIGRRLLDMLNIAHDVALGVATHHEWIDGSGTPGGLKGKEIPWNGKIVAIFEYVVQFIEGKRQISTENDNLKDELVQALVHRAGKQFDMILIPTVVQLIESMSWKDICNLGMKR